MEPRKPSLALAVLIFLAVAVLIVFSVLVWEVDIHISLILGAILAGIFGVFYLKYDYATIEKGIIDGIMTGMQACLILYTVGPLVGTWIASGVVPTMIYYGLSILSPGIFLFATLIMFGSCTFNRYFMGNIRNSWYSPYGYSPWTWDPCTSDSRCHNLRSLLRR